MGSGAAEYEMISEETSIEISQLKVVEQQEVSIVAPKTVVLDDNPKNLLKKTNTLPAQLSTGSQEGADRKKSNSVDENAMTASAKMAFSNATYCVTREQLQGVLLKRTENVSKLEASVSSNGNVGGVTSNLAVTKSDLIEELKMAKNLEGIKKVKESHRNVNEVSLDC